MELWGERHERRKSHYIDLIESTEINYSHTDRKDIADCKSDEDRERTQESACKDLGNKASKESHTADDPIGDTSEICCTLTTGKAVGTDRQESRYPFL